MKELVRERILRLCRRIESGISSCRDISVEAENNIELILQLSQVSEQTDMPDVDKCLQHFYEAIGHLQQLDDKTNDASAHHLHFEVPDKRFPGRPRFDIPFHFLEFMLNSNFKITQIAKVLGVSSTTVQRRMQEFNLTISSMYTNITDENLDDTISVIISNFPGIGYRTVRSHLVTQQIRITEHRVREATRRMDAEGSLLRRLCLTVIKRRRYSVRAPQALWHIDGYHKLIRFENLL